MEIDEARNIPLQEKGKDRMWGGPMSYVNAKQLWNSLAFNFCTTHFFDGIYSPDTLKTSKKGLN